MTAPWNGFGTHDGSPLRPRKRHEIVQMFSELPRLHVVRKATEAEIFPPEIDGIPGCMPESTQTWHVPVVKAGGVQGGRQLPPVELRIVPGSGDGTHVDKAPYAVRFQKTDEFLDGVRGMSNGQDYQGRRCGALLHVIRPR